MTEPQVTACGTLAPTFVSVVELTRKWADDVMEEVSSFDDVYGTDVDEVPNRGYDGFIPFTDGGFNGIGRASMSYCWGSGNVPKAIQPYLDAELKRIEEAWDEKNPDCTVAMLYETPEPVKLEEAGQIPLPGIPKEKDDWQRRQHPRLDEYHELESESMSEGGTYFYKARVLFHGDRHKSVSGEPEAYFMVGVNVDFEYGRDTIPWLAATGGDPQCTKWLWEKTIKVKDLTEEIIDSFIKDASDALRLA